MSKNMNVAKWVPLQAEEHKALYLECKQLKRSTLEVIESLDVFLSELSKKTNSKLHCSLSENEFLIQDLEDLLNHVEALREGFNKAFSNLNMAKPHLTEVITNNWKDMLWKIKLKLCYFLQQCVSQVAHLFIYYGEEILFITIRISLVHNQCIQLDVKHNLNKNALMCSNTCPYLVYPLRKISVTRLLQILVQNRAELCCHKLMDCLLETYRFYDGHDDDNGSDNSSIEIYRALTWHMSPPTKVLSSPDVKTDEAVDNMCFVNMEELIRNEEQNVLDLMSGVFKVAPSMLGSRGIKTTKNNGQKISARAMNKVLDYYQQILWGEVGSFLEHVILWWGAMPLSLRPPHSSQHLREWINQFTPTADVPPFILSALSCLSDALGVHVISTSWDQHFRLALVASKTTCNPETGRLFCEMLHDLVSLCNQCEMTNEWIEGAALEELPLVEQIPVLHRLDHSVHTTRLWSINETKKLANTWNVKSFFLITHCDIVNCLAELATLKQVDHTVEIEKGGLNVHVQVCANMRAKLMSETTVNIQKLKETPLQCVNCLASVCRTISLANLQMVFPRAEFWKVDKSEPSNVPSEYVQRFLDQILLPVLRTSEDYQISNMILKIMCESWLDHVYTNRVKFSQHGALQLLTDFAFVSTWIINCPIITQVMRKKMLKNEVLKRCEGVGRLLLRCPGEHIKMSEKFHKKEDPQSSPTSENTMLMPAEMYVPNQEQWLELQATKRRTFSTRLCCGT